MKRIIDGKTYNTETAIKIARSVFKDDIENKTDCETLYQTKGGSFFLVEETSFEGDVEPDIAFVSLTRGEAEEWMEVGEVEVFGEHPFGWPPEASAEEDKKLDAAE
jgi:hypothetical protein